MSLNKYAKKWIKALRSGKYSQCKNKLTKDGGYCCLGVAEEVINPNGKWRAF